MNWRKSTLLINLNLKKILVLILLDLHIITFKDESRGLFWRFRVILILIVLVLWLLCWCIFPFSDLLKTFVYFCLLNHFYLNICFSLIFHFSFLQWINSECSNFWFMSILNCFSSYFFAALTSQSTILIVLIFPLTELLLSINFHFHNNFFYFPIFYLISFQLQIHLLCCSSFFEHAIIRVYQYICI